MLWCWLKYGLLPLRWQNSYLAGPDAPLQRACRAAARGRWEPAAQLFEDAGQDWERRSLYAQRLGDVVAQGSDRWLKEWRKARPGDPTPLVAELWTARGLGYSHAETDALWSRITELAPYHFEAHTSALQYWTAKWRGSHQLAREFAEKSAAGAPPGSLLAVLPVIAWYESHKDELGPVGYCPPDLRALVDAALTDAALADPDHPRLPEVRHLLGYFLYRQGRYRAAREQFRHVDGFTEALPWRYSRLAPLHYRAVRTKTGRRALMERRWR
ncbi:hypothetical protein [Streptomyces tendae]|uniref:hypothetical protein n=1 Tax=Streptomyces tendae TaxID=1932 RepID=UPI0036547DC5